MNPRPSRLAWTLLGWLAADDGLVGDLDEEYRNGKTSGWFWRQALSLIVLSPARHIRTHPLSVVRDVALGWAVFLAVFATFETFIAPRLLGSDTENLVGGWPPFWVGAFICSYVGFAASAWIVSRIHRNDAGPVLLLHIVSVLLAMTIALKDFGSH